jgi:polar amino acid transport system substrate-binding protein
MSLSNLWWRLWAVGVVTLLIACAAFPSGTAAATAAVPAPGKSPTIDAIKKRGTLRGCVAVAMPVVGLNPSTKDYFGTGIDFGNELAKRLSVKLELVPSEWDTIIPSLQSGKCDVVLAGLGFRPERAKVVDYVMMGQEGTCYLALRSNTKVNTWDDIVKNPDVTVAVITGTGWEHMFRSEYPNVKIRSVPSPGSEALEQEVLSGRATVTPIDSWVEAIYRSQYPQLKIIPNDCSTNPISSAQWGHAVLKGDPAYHEWVNTVATEVKDSGWFNERWKYWSAPERMKSS